MQAGLPVAQCVGRLKRMHYAFWRLHQICIAHIAAEPVYELKMAFSHHGYLPHARQDFERWIVEKVPVAARMAAGSTDAAPGFFLCGLSMGGFGAMRLGARYAHRCAGISAHSAITDSRQMSDFIEEDVAAFCPGEPPANVLGEILARRESLPPLRFDCGLDDDLLEANRRLHQELEEQGGSPSLRRVSRRSRVVLLGEAPGRFAPLLRRLAGPVEPSGVMARGIRLSKLRGLRGIVSPEKVSITH